MNELLFFFHIIVMVGFALLALRMGKLALVASLAVQVLLANLFVTKQMICFGLSVTCSDVYTIGAVFSMTLLQTYFGKKCAKKSLSIAFFLLFFMIIMAQFQLRYRPSTYDEMHPAFSAILGSTPRIMATSFLATFLTQKLNIELFGWTKKRLPLGLSFALAALTTQLLDTVIFSYVALYGIAHSMKEIILMSYLIKMATIFSMAPFTLLVKKWIKHEPVQV